MTQSFVRSLAFAACALACAWPSRAGAAAPSAAKKAAPAAEAVYFPFEANGKWGYKDENEKIVLEPRYDETNYFKEGLAHVKVGAKWGYLDRTMKMAIEPSFEDAWSFSEGLAVVRVNGKWGFIDKTGALAVPARYDQVMPFSEGRAFVMYNHLEPGWSPDYPFIATGFIDKSGAVVITSVKNQDLIYESGSFKSGLAVVNDTKQKPMKCGYVDRTGTIAIPMVFDKCGEFKGDEAPAKKDGKGGVVDKTGRFTEKPS